MQEGEKMDRLSLIFIMQSSISLIYYLCSIKMTFPLESKVLYITLLTYLSWSFISLQALSTLTQHIYAAIGGGIVAILYYCIYYFFYDYAVIIIAALMIIMCISYLITNCFLKKYLSKTIRIVKVPNTIESDEDVEKMLDEVIQNSNLNENDSYEEMVDKIYNTLKNMENQSNEERNKTDNHN